MTGEGEIYGANYQNLKSFLQIRAYLSVARCKLGGTAGRALGGIWIERQWKNNAAEYDCRIQKTHLRLFRSVWGALQ